MNTIEAQKILSPEFQDKAKKLSEVIRRGLEFITMASAQIGKDIGKGEEANEELCSQVDMVTRAVHEAALSAILVGVSLGKKLHELESGGPQDDYKPEEVDQATKATEALFATLKKKHD